MIILEKMKKTYIAPETELICLSTGLALQDRLMNSFSGGGTNSGDPTVNPDPDESEDDNQSNKYSNSLWDSF